MLRILEVLEFYLFLQVPLVFNFFSFFSVEEPKAIGRSEKMIQLAQKGLTEENGKIRETRETLASGQSGTGASQREVVGQGLNFYVVQTAGSTKTKLVRIPMPKPARNRRISESESSDPYDSADESSDSYEPSNSDHSSESSDESEVPQVQPAEPPRSHSLNTTAPQDDGGSADVPISLPISPKKRPKKRLRKCDEWKTVKAKKLKNSGESYLSRTGKVVEARKMGPPCSEKCKLKCFEKVSDDLRASLFKNYWAMSSLQRQRDYLHSCIEPIQVKYRRISLSVQKPRKPNCGFYITNSEQKIRVCKTFLMNTLAISERAIRTVIIGKMSETGIAPSDGRGKHGHHRKNDPEIMASVRNHIKSIPRIESHYVRRDTTREFIDGGLTASQMHRDYSEDRISANLKPASYDTYLRVFNTEFNIGFFMPKKDQCDACEGYKNATDIGKSELEEQYQQHLEEKELSREEKNMDKEKAKRKEIFLAVYDLQAVLPVPMGQSSAFFYKSKLNCYNFTVGFRLRSRNFFYFTIYLLTYFITQSLKQVSTYIIVHKFQQLSNLLIPN